MKVELKHSVHLNTYLSLHNKQSRVYFIELIRIMGKRNKLCTNTCQDLNTNDETKSKKCKLSDSDTIEESTKPSPLCTPRKNRKKKNKMDAKKNVSQKNNVQKNVELKESESTSSNVTILNKRGNKKNKVHEENNIDLGENKVISEEKVEAESPDLTEVSTSLEEINKKKKKTNKDKNKKTIFIDDEPVEVNKDTNNKKKNRDIVLSQEDDVKDEDIDKFCDEINEEDNVQYENWIKLLEAKLGSNKKKPK